MVQIAKLGRSLAPLALMRVIAPAALAFTIICTAVAAHAQSDDEDNATDDDVTTVESEVAPDAAPTDVTQEGDGAFEQPIDLTAPLTMPSGNSIDPSRFTQGLSPSPWTAKAGIDNRDVTPYADLRLERWLPGTALPEQSVGVAWATIAAPGLMAWDKAAIETRVDPYEQTRFGVTLSRSVPVGNEVSMTLQNGFAWTQPLLQGAPVVAHGSHVMEGNHAVRFTFLPVDTTLSIGAATSSAESGWRPSLSAEQRLFGGPFSITGAISETATGDFDRSFRAGFKQRW
jgi:hypothetical protein